MQPPRPNIRSSQCSHHAQIWRHISYIMFMSSWPHIRSSQCTLWQIRAFSHNVHWQLLIWGHDDMNMMSEAPYMPIYSMGTKGRGHRQIDISIYGHKRVMMVHTAAAQQQFEPTSSQRTIITYLHIWRLLRTASPLFNHIFIWLFLTNVHDNISCIMYRQQTTSATSLSVTSPSVTSPSTTSPPYWYPYLGTHRSFYWCHCNIPSKHLRRVILGCFSWQSSPTHSCRDMYAEAISGN